MPRGTVARAPLIHRIALATITPRNNLLAFRTAQRWVTNRTQQCLALFWSQAWQNFPRRFHRRFQRLNRPVDDSAFLFQRLEFSTEQAASVFVNSNTTHMHGTS